MSTIKVDNIRIASESVSRPVTGVAAALASWDGTATTPTLIHSVNVSSLADVATGRYQPNFTNDFTDGSFETAAIGQARSMAGVQNSSASYVEIRYSNYLNDDHDRERCSATIHGELA